MNLISVIVPVYNVERYIRRCLDSILRQTYPNIEIIIINDGSTDASGEICRQYETEYKNILVIHQKNMGVSSARNKGLDIAKGEYIGFIDGDDWIELNMYETLIECIYRYDAEVCICSKRYDEAEIRREFYGSQVVIDNHLAADQLIKGFYPASLDTSLYKRTVIMEERLNTDIHYWEDLEFNLRILQKATSISICHTPLYHVSIHADSATKRPVNYKNLTCLMIPDLLHTDVYDSSIRTLAPILQYRFLMDITAGVALKGADEIRYINSKIRNYAARNLFSIFRSSHISVRKKIYFVIIMISPCFFQKVGKVTLRKGKIYDRKT